MIKKLRQLIAQGSICDEETFQNYESKLVARDDIVFEARWIASFKQLSKTELSDELQTQLDCLRELAFKAVYERTQNSDLSALVSDDFELIGRSTSLGISLPWVNALWIAYRNREFPHGKLELLDGSLEDYI